ncbi:MAG: chemotaxis protein CheW [Candidatus Goldbacteria bacterium]|nr:chemotaxis protein CheW [Candidatus Goldiibacteriota bacterium]
MEAKMQNAVEVQAKAGKYLTFRLAKEEYGVEILKVREIIGLMPITRVPKTPEFVRGVINLRGGVIPVVELRSKFGMESEADTNETCVIVVEIMKQKEPVQIGILVDSVSEVMDIAGADIEATPSFGVELDTNYILGMAKTRGTVRILLNIDRVLTNEELESVGNTPG